MLCVFIYPVATSDSSRLNYLVPVKVSNVIKNILRCTVDSLSDMNRSSRA